MRDKGIKALLLQAGVELFRENGNLSATNLDICLRANVNTPSSIQGRFGTRDELLLAVIRVERKRYQTNHLEPLKGVTAAMPYAALKAFLRSNSVGVSDAELKAGFLFGNVAGELRLNQTALRAELDDTFLEIERSLAGGIRALKAHAAFRLEPEIAAAQLFAYLQAARLRARLSQRREPLAAFMKNCAAYTGVNELAL